MIHPAHLAFRLHRLSGVVLALFLPVHFLVLGLAVRAETLDGFLRWADQPLVKLAEAGLLGLLGLHLGCGLRVLAIEGRLTIDRRGRWVAAAFGLGLALATLFLFAASR